MSEPAEPSTAQLDSVRLRTLAHPARARLLGLLRIEGPATATALAQRLGTNSGQTSYHLRQLAAVGLVVEDTERTCLTTTPGCVARTGQSTCWSGRWLTAATATELLIAHQETFHDARHRSAVVLPVTWPVPTPA